MARTLYKYCKATKRHGHTSRFCLNGGRYVHEGDNVFINGFSTPGVVVPIEGDWRVRWPDDRGLLLKYARHIVLAEGGMMSDLPHGKPGHAGYMCDECQPARPTHYCTLLDGEVGK